MIVPAPFFFNEPAGKRVFSRLNDDLVSAMSGSSVHSSSSGSLHGGGGGTFGTSGSALGALDKAPNSASEALDSSRLGMLESLLKSLQTSALTAEANASDAANKLQRELMERQFAFNAAEARKNRLFQQNSAREAMAFSARQAASQWQRAVKDMRQAGINPIYAFQNGGASAASGVSASGSAASGGLASADKADFSSAKSADLTPLSLLFNGLASLFKGISLFQ